MSADLKPSWVQILTLWIMGCATLDKLAHLALLQDHLKNGYEKNSIGSTSRGCCKNFTLTNARKTEPGMYGMLDAVSSYHYERKGGHKPHWRDRSYPVVIRRPRVAVFSRWGPDGSVATSQRSGGNLAGVGR